MEEPIWNREKSIAAYWEIAIKEPEDTRGSLTVQIEACKRMYELGHEPALGRLSELANIDPARTKGNRRGQESAAKLLKRLVSSIKVDKTNGSFEGQISACKSLYEKVEYAPAIQRLNEIANMDPSETGGRQTDQKAAAEALREIVGSVKPDKTGVQ